MDRKLLILIPVIVLLMGCTSQPDQPQWEIQDRMDYRYGIFTMDSDGTKVVQIYGSGRSLSGASLSPGGRIVFYELEGGIGAGLSSLDTSEIAVVNIDGRGYRKLTDNGWMDFQPKWSTDGSEILFISTGGRSAGTDIYVMDLNGSIIRQLTDTPGISEADPDWKCGKVVFTRNQSIWIMDDDGSNPRQLTDPPGKGAGIGVQFPVGDYDPSISPDCSKVVFERLTGPGLESGGTTIGDYDLYVHDIASGTETEISNDEAADFIPKWSPDGSRILFIHVSDSPEDAYDVYVTNPDGTGRKKVTGEDPPNFVENGCSWIGSKILFTAEWF